MKRKRLTLFASMCVLFAMIFSIVAFAGDYDTPVVPIHTKHYYYLLSTTQPTCTEAGLKTYKCRQCTSTYTEDVPALGHLYRYNSNGQIKCRYCTDVIAQASYSQLLGFWSDEFINKAPQRTETDNSGYLDLNGDNIINAKDYGLIVHLNNEN
jgi:hypothetical protein